MRLMLLGQLKRGCCAKGAEIVIREHDANVRLRLKVPGLKMRTFGQKRSCSAAKKVSY